LESAEAKPTSFDKEIFSYLSAHASTLRTEDLPGWHSRPLHVAFAITNKCCLKCKHCFSSSTIEDQSDLDPTALVALTEHLIDEGVFQFGLSGGEPFISPALRGIIETLTRHSRSFYINTNGTIIDKKTLSLIAQSGHLFSGFTISLDGCSKEAHDGLRGKGAFDKLLEGVELIKSFDFPFRFFTVINKLNHKEIPSIIDLARRLGAYRIDLNAFGAMGRAGSHAHELELSPHEHVAVLRLSRRLMDHFGSFMYGFYPGSVKATLRHERFFYELANNPDVPKPKEGTFQACGGLRRECTVLANGKVVPCQSLQSYVIGNLNENTLANIWQLSEKAHSFRQLASIPLSAADECRQCPYIHTCNGNCRAMAAASASSILACDPFCFYPSRNYRPIWGVL